MISKMYYIISLGTILMFSLWQISSLFLSPQVKPYKSYKLGNFKNTEEKRPKAYIYVEDEKERLALKEDEIFVGDEVEEGIERKVFELIADDASKSASWKYVKISNRPKIHKVKNEKERFALAKKVVWVGDEVEETENNRLYELTADNPSKFESWKRIRPAITTHYVKDSKERLALDAKKVLIEDNVEESYTRKTYLLIAADPSKTRSWKLVKTNRNPKYHYVYGESELYRLDKREVWVGDEVEDRISYKVYRLVANDPSKPESWEYVRAAPTPTPTPTPYSSSSDPYSYPSSSSSRSGSSYPSGGGYSGGK